ncbi:MAG: helix-turn-helix domain-containing protein [Candidatus Dormibacteraeota bacterium]|nr:helix-turn-helix domain-containing protein [Candidatus Dormibacteraeota bacterium]
MDHSRHSSGLVLREARLRAGLSQSELAQRAGVAQSVISMYESGRRQPSLRTLAALVAPTGLDLVLDLRPAPGLDRLTGPHGQRVLAARSQLKTVAARYGVLGLAVFGSVARGEERPDSDVDLLGELPTGMGLFGLGRLQSDLEAVVGLPVDLIPAGDLKPNLRGRVVADLVPL